MENVEVKNEELTKTVKENRANHQAVFEEALAGYKKKSIEVLEKTLEDAKSGKQILEMIHIQRPTNQVKDYNRVLKMLEMSVDDTIILSEHEFAKYVMDDWSWKRQFLVSNAGYSNMATSALAETEWSD